MNKNTIGILFVVCFVHFVLGFDINIVSISLYPISQYFNISPDIASRIMWMYFLILTCFLQIFGKLADIKGFKFLYISGILIFSTFSLLCGISVDFTSLTIFRTFQAIGAAILFGLTPALISEHFANDIKGKIFGVNYSFVAIGGVAGRFLSGILVEEFSWRFIFLINLPVCLIALLIGILAIPNEKQKTKDKKIDEKFDLLGSIFLFLTLFGLLYFLNIINKSELHSFKVIIPFFLFLVFLPVFIYRELKISFPLLNLRLLKNLNLTKQLSLFFLIYIFTNGMIFISPFFLQKIFTYSAKTTGFLLTITSTAQIFSGYLSGYLVDKTSSKYIIFYGLGLTFISMILFSTLGVDSEIYLIIFLLGLYGISVGLTIPANTKAVMEYAPEFAKGSVSAFMITIIRIGSAFGICLYGILYSLLLNGESGTSGTNIIGYKYIFLFGALVSLLGTIISLTINNNKKKNN